MPYRGSVTSAVTSRNVGVVRMLFEKQNEFEARRTRLFIFR